MASSTDKIEQTFAMKPCQKLRGETNCAFGVVHLPDVRRIITCSRGASLQLWDLESGAQIGSPWREGGYDDLDVQMIALSPNGKTVASGSSNGTVRLWDIEAKKVVARWTKDGDLDVVSLCWSIDGEHVLTGNLGGVIRMWNIRSGNTTLGPIETGHTELYVATYLHDQTKIATGGEDEDAINIWDATTGEQLSTVKHDSPVLSLASTSDQKKLISGSDDGSIRIFDTATWDQIAILHHENRDGVAALALFQNDCLLASVSGDIRLWDLDTNLPVGTPIQNEVDRAAISADGKLLVTFAWHTNYVWDIHTILKDPGLKSLLSISKVLQGTLKMLRPIKSLPVLNISDGATRRPAELEDVHRPPQGLFDNPRDYIESSTNKNEHTFTIKPCQKLRGKTSRVIGVVHLPDVRRIITSSVDGLLLLWDLESGERIGDAWKDDGDDHLDVERIALSPNGKTVASGSYDGIVRLWDIETKKVVARWTKDGDLDVVSLCWSIDGEHVLTGNWEGMIRVWNIRSGNTILGPIKTGHEELYVATYLHDQTKIATGGQNNVGAIIIWDATTGELLSTVNHDSPVRCLASTSDQKKLISGSDDGSIRIFDTATWNQIAILEGHADYVRVLSLFQNDRLLASVSDDHDIRLWDLDTNLPVGPPIQRKHVNGAAISADGKVLVTYSSDTKRHYIWDIHTIIKGPGLKSLLSISNALQDTLEMLRAAGSLSVLSFRATRRSATLDSVPRLPEGFFDDSRDGFQSSTIPVTHVRPSTFRRRGFTASLDLRPHALLNQLSSLFRRSQPNTSQATALQQLPRQSRHRPSVVEVATAQDKQTLYVARRPGDKGKQIPQQQAQAQASTSNTPPQVTIAGAAATQPQPTTTITQQQQGQSQDEAQASTSQTPPAATSTSITPPHVTTSGAAATQSQPATTSKNPTWWARFVFFICCASIDQYR